ncbi:MAG: indole-3-glycerol phosphate synthase TrpC [Bacillota bacterium]|nr:indole-3-glycerol phosphate synthase TrpC [Bacillota bacterium]
MILDTITDSVKKRVEKLKKEAYYDKFLQNKRYPTARNFEAAFTGSLIGVIGEIKKASPSKGIIVENFNHLEIADLYEELKVDAVSVLTEEDFFQGRLSYLKDVKERVSRPVLRKDFIVDEMQLYEARAYGADAVLLIAAVLKDKLGYYYNLTKELGLHSLVEVHDEEELEDALIVGAGIIGINNRNLKTFKVDIETTERLIGRIPGDRIVISESGIESFEDVKRLRTAGVRGLLIGESFMRRLDNKQDMKNFLDGVKGV